MDLSGSKWGTATSHDVGADAATGHFVTTEVQLWRDLRRGWLDGLSLIQLWSFWKCQSLLQS